jgi:hypothetical protein
MLMLLLYEEHEFVHAADEHLERLMHQDAAGLQLRHLELKEAGCCG